MVCCISQQFQILALGLGRSDGIRKGGRSGGQLGSWSLRMFSGCFVLCEFEEEMAKAKSFVDLEVTDLLR